MADEEKPGPKVQKVWINFYKPFVGACGSVYSSRKLADQMAGRDRLACKEVEITEGEGLDG